MKPAVKRDILNNLLLALAALLYFAVGFSLGRGIGGLEGRAQGRGEAWERLLTVFRLGQQVGQEEVLLDWRECEAAVSEQRAGKQINERKE